MISTKLHYAIVTAENTVDKIKLFDFSRYENYKPIEVHESDRYVDFLNNEHHWHIDYVWNSFIPMLMKDLNIDFNPDDFVFVKNFDSTGAFDLSYHNPKQDDMVEITFMATSVKADLKISDLRLPPNNNGFGGTFGTFTDYHRLYRGAHDVTFLRNDNAVLNRHLMMNCDSMMIPVIPILIHYFKQIFVLDNRFSISYDSVINDYLNIATDYIGCLWHENIIKYQDRYLNNLR